MIRVLIAEDSPTACELLAKVLGADPDVTIVGQAADGQQAVEMTRRLRPDVVTMDIHMPNMNGLDATKRIMSETPTPIVIISGTVNAGDIETSMRALRAGALMVLGKLDGPADGSFDERCRRLTATVRAMSQVKVVSHWPQRMETPPLPLPNGRRTRSRIVAVAASTGGPAALQQLLSSLPAAFQVPILVVQHIGAEFTEGLVNWLNTACHRPVKMAVHGEPLAPRTVYVACGKRHLGVSPDSTIVLADAPPVGGLRPSANYLFESVGRTFGGSALAVILTGMGRDGVDGLHAVKRFGGYIIAQDEASSVVFGMPKAAIETGLADAILPLASIGQYLANFA